MTLIEENFVERASSDEKSLPIIVVSRHYLKERNNGEFFLYTSTAQLSFLIETGRRHLQVVPPIAACDWSICTSEVNGWARSRVNDVISF